MTVIVTRKPSGVTQLFNTETGRVSYKCKAESALMYIEAFDGIGGEDAEWGTAAIVSPH